MFEALLTWIITAVGLFVISKLPLGIEIDDFGTAIVAALILGLLNAFLAPILRFFAFPITLLTLGLFSLVINAIVFSLAAALLKGFRVNGCLPALVGPIVLSILTTLISAIFR